MKNEFYKTKEEIENWLNKYNITKYELIPNDKYGFVVDAKYVDLSEKNLNWIPIKFDFIGGFLNVNNNKLKSLEFCPSQINGSFNCSDNDFRNLEFCPQIIWGNFCVANNDIENLLWFPQKAGSCDMKGNKRLLELENITRFSVLHKEHLKQLDIKNSKESLDKKIENDRIIEIKKKNKI